MYLGEKKWYIFKNFFFRWSFRLKMGQNVICQKKYRWPRGGLKYFLFSIVALWWNSHHFSPKKFFCSSKNDKVDQMILLWPNEKTAILGAREELFRAKKVRISPLSNWLKQKKFWTPPLPPITNLKKITFRLFSNPKLHPKKKFLKIDHFFSPKFTQN